MDDWRIAEAENQMRCRDFNEWIQDTNVRMESDRPLEQYICECSDGTCRQPISLTTEEYERVRAYPLRFAIALNHENPELDRVLMETERFATAEKLPGPGARRARQTDPRK